MAQTLMEQVALALATSPVTVEEQLAAALSGAAAANMPSAELGPDAARTVLSARLVAVSYLLSVRLRHTLESGELFALRRLFFSLPRKPLCRNGEPLSGTLEAMARR